LTFFVVKNFEEISEELHARIRKEDRERLLRKRKAILESALHSTHVEKRVSQTYDCAS